MLLVTQYQRGGSHEVWDRLRGLKDALREEPFATEAKLVADETMRRVRANLDILSARLRKAGYQFAGVPLAPPAADIEHRIDRIEEAIGSLSHSLRAFYRIVGAVDFRGTHPGWPLPGYVPPDELPSLTRFPGDVVTLADPIVFAPLDDDYVLREWSVWKSLVAADGLEATGAFHMTLGPGRAEKANLPGENPCSVALPQLGADARILEEEGVEAFFVNALRRYIEWAGLRGLSTWEHPPVEWIEGLTTGLSPV